MQSGTINVPFPVPTLQVTFKLASIYLRTKVMKIAKKKKKKVLFCLTLRVWVFFFLISVFFKTMCIQES